MNFKQQLFYYFRCKSLAYKEPVFHNKIVYLQPK